jgi:nodulation protein E
MNRVVITGIGIVSPVGCTLSDFWSALVEARSGVGPITIIPTEGLLIRIAAQVLGFDPTAHFESRQANLLDRFARFAVVAARAAVRDAELEIDEPHALEAVTIVGSGVGGQVAMDDQYYKIYGQKHSKVHPLTIPRLMINAAASNISMDLGLKGPTYSVARMRIGHARDRSGVSSAAHGAGSVCPCRRQRGVPDIRHAQRLGSTARAHRRCLPTFLQDALRPGSG